MIKIKALTIYQPWAQLIATGKKRYETRSYRFPTIQVGSLLAIHSGKKNPMDVVKNTPRQAVKKIHNLVGYFSDLPLGYIVAIVKIMSIHRTDSLIESNRFVESDEFLFGHYDPGRIAIGMLLKRKLTTPILARGQQGLWNWEPPDWATKSKYGKEYKKESRGEWSLVDDVEHFS